jgi:hypothetical protein
MTTPVPPLVISSDPWVGKDGPASVLDQGLLEAVIAADIPQVQRSLRLGGSALCKFSRSLSKEHASPISLCMRHEEIIAKALITEMLTTLPGDPTARIAWLQEACSSAGFHASDPLMEWVVDQTVKAIPIRSTGWLWRTLAARRRWAVVVSHRALLLEWSDAPDVYSLAFVFSRSALSMCPFAVAASLDLVSILKDVSREDGASIAQITIDEVSLQMGFVHELSMSRLEDAMGELARQMPGVRQAADNLNASHDLSGLLDRVLGKMDAEKERRALERSTLLAQEQAGDHRRL